MGNWGFGNKDALTLDLRECRGSTITWTSEDCNRIWTTNIVLPKLSLFICLHSLWFYKLKRPWRKPVETVERIKPFHLSSPHHRCYRERNKHADKASQLHFPGWKVFPVPKTPTTIFRAHMLTPHCKCLWWACPSRAHLSPVIDIDPGSHRQHWLRQIFNSLKVLSCRMTFYHFPERENQNVWLWNPSSILSYLKYPVHKCSSQIATAAPCAKNRKAWPWYVTVQFPEPWTNPLYGHKCWWNICVSCIPSAFSQSRAWDMQTISEQR